MIAFGVVYFFAAVAASGIFIVAGCLSKKTVDEGSGRSRFTLALDPLFGDIDTDMSDEPNQADAGQALRVAVRRLAPLMSGQFVQAEIATAPVAPVRMHRSALIDMLEELLTVAIHSAPASRLLLTAGARGDRVWVGVEDDMPGANRLVRLARVRDLRQRIALRGGTLDVDVRPSEGTTMTVGFASAMELQADGSDWLPPGFDGELAEPIFCWR